MTADHMVEFLGEVERAPMSQTKRLVDGFAVAGHSNFSARRRNAAGGERNTSKAKRKGTNR